jgi:V/A-type H+/Na+-transporting ATPase subunit E
VSESNITDNTSSSNSELSKLISALRDEGVDKGRKEADDIIEEAKKEAARIVESARSEADKIVESAHAKSKTTLDQLEQQLTLALRDFLLKAKVKLEKLIALKPLREKAAEALSDVNFLKKLINEIVAASVGGDADSKGVHVTVPEGVKKEFIGEWVKMMQNELNVTAIVSEEAKLVGFKMRMDDQGGELIVDPDSIIEVLRPLVSEKFRYILDSGKLPKE